MSVQSLLAAFFVPFALAASATPHGPSKMGTAPPPTEPAAQSTTRPSAESTRAIAAASNAFAADLWHRVDKSPGNLSISPASMSAALAMTWGGAKGETARQMSQVLHLGDDPKTAGVQWAFSSGH